MDTETKPSRQPLFMDINADLGESFGIYRLPGDEQLLDLVSSANIACGYHAGDPSVMRRTVRLCLEKGVSIGAHPGFPDREGFGRRSMSCTTEEVYDMTLYQIGALDAFVRSEGGRLRHVKPHGALYNMAAVQRHLAEAIADAVFRYNPELTLVGLAGSNLLEAGRARGLRTAAEAFVDRSYQADGTLTPRHERNAVFHDPAAICRQVVRLAQNGEASGPDGSTVYVGLPDTLCLHGDTAQQENFAERLKKLLSEADVRIRALP
ncbi:LamB/YcsF family protein [Paenibacillus turpanensis]|uniref:LamB/YcsF family protein n=1 Tax=Paenibacillus turpanensis TaxID=2689078 RepID=UPI00140BA86E|nr:5-oxoprolinase subunit PxpA [Paenibacillus turpanensis]